MVRLSGGRKGYILLLSVLIIGVVAVAITVSVLLLGLNSSRSAYSFNRSGEARALVNTCAEEALEQIRLNSNYSGSQTINLGSGNCTFTVTNLGGQNRQIIASSTVGRVIRRVSISLNKVNPKVNIASWQETP